MPNFQYKAMDAKGKEKKGRVEAGDQQAAAAKLKEMGLFPTEIKAAAKSGKKSDGGAKKGSAGVKGGTIMLGAPKIKKKNLPQFTRQLATLLQSGLPLVRALRTLEKQARKDVASRMVIGGLAESVEGGTSFSEALAAHPKTFSHLFVNMVKAGEAAGDLEATLDRLAGFMEKSQRVASKIKAAMMYPAVVLTIALLITAGLLVFIVPRFASIFDDMLPGESLPGLTLMVLTISEILQKQLLLAVVVIAVLVVIFVQLKKTKKGGYAVDWALLKLPPMNGLVIRSAVARFAQTLATLLNSGVSILQALEIVRDTSGNVVVADALQKIHDSVKEGEGMSHTMESTGVFPLMVVSLVEVGEETGAVADMLNRVADIYEEEVDNAVDALTSLIEPIMIVFLAGVVGTIVIAMFLPLIKLMSNLGG